MERMRHERQAPESIRSAAIKFSGEIYTGITHGSAVLNLEKAHPNWRASGAELLQEGFVTSSGRFVDRAEAGEIADRASQLNHLQGETRADAASSLDSYNLRH